MTYNYVLVRSRRRSISVSVSFDNVITVRCPMRTPVSEVERFLLSKNDWLQAHIDKNKSVSGEFANIIDYKTVLVKGKELPLVVGGKNYITDTEVSVKNLGNLNKLYKDYLGGDFFILFYKIAAENGLNAACVSFKNYKSRWGCCDRKGNIIFNYKLLMLPEDLQRYVIVHELCHTLYMNHSSNFKSAVSAILPDYKRYVNEIKRYSFVTRLY